MNKGLEVGSTFPDFALPDENGELKQLSELQGDDVMILPSGARSQVASIDTFNGSIDEAQYRAHPVSDPLGTTVASSASQAVLFSGSSTAAPHRFPPRRKYSIRSCPRSIFRSLAAALRSE